MDRDAIVKALVKGLEWDAAKSDGYWRVRIEGHITYEVYGLSDSRFILDRIDALGGKTIGDFPTLAAAQAAAEADYRARIGAALRVDLIEALVEAADMAMKCNDACAPGFSSAMDDLRTALAAFRGDATKEGA